MLAELRPSLLIVVYLAFYNNIPHVPLISTDTHFVEIPPFLLCSHESRVYATGMDPDFYRPNTVYSSAFFIIIWLMLSGATTTTTILNLKVLYSQILGSRVVWRYFYRIMCKFFVQSFKWLLDSFVCVRRSAITSLVSISPVWDM